MVGDFICGGSCILEDYRAGGDSIDKERGKTIKGLENKDQCFNIEGSLTFLIHFNFPFLLDM